MPATVLAKSTSNGSRNDHDADVRHPSIQPIEVSSRDGLFSALDQVKIEGWDGPTAHAVLRYAMRAVVIPAVRRIGVAASAAEFSESTGWAAAWETLRSPKLREAASPWGVVKANVRHAVIAERIAATYGTDETVGMADPSHPYEGPTDEPSRPRELGRRRTAVRAGP